jgi:hypothetical protein
MLTVYQYIFTDGEPKNTPSKIDGKDILKDKKAV